MSDDPVVVDIMLPFWGPPELLFEAVRSVLDQSDPGWRLTVIDDAYPSESVPQFFADLDDERVRYLRNDSNVGIMENFRRCAELASAEYTTILGSDDRLLPDYVRLLRTFLARSPDVDIFAPAVVVIDENGDPHHPLADRVKALLTPPPAAGPVRLEGEALVASLVRGNWLYWPSLAIRTARLKQIPFRLDLPIILDLAFILDVAFDGGALMYMNGEPSFEYRRHESSLSQTAISDGVRFRDEARFHREVSLRARTRGWRRAARWAALRPSSRLHSAAALPGAVRSRDSAASSAAARNVFGR